MLHNKSVKIALKETSVTLKSFIRQKSTIAWVVIIPIILTVICSSLILAFDDQGTAYVYVQDNDDTNVSRKTIKMIDEQITVIQVDNGLSMDELVKMKEKDPRYVVGIVILPEGYKSWAINAVSHKDGKAMVYLDDASYEIELKASDTPSSSNEPIISITTKVNGGIGKAIEDIFGDDQSLFVHLTPGILIGIMSEIVLGLVISARSLIREKRTNMMIRNTWLGKHHVLFANMICGLVPSFIVCTISLIIIELCHPVALTATTIVFLFLSSLCLVSLGLLLSVFIHNRQSSSIAVAAILVPLLILSGAAIPVSSMYDWMQTLSQISPMTYMISGLKQSLGIDLGTNMWLCVAVILISTVIFSTLWIVLESRRSERSL